MEVARVNLQERVQQLTMEQIVPEHAKEIVDKPLADCRKEKHKEKTEGGMKEAYRVETLDIFCSWCADVENPSPSTAGVDVGSGSGIIETRWWTLSWTRSSRLQEDDAREAVQREALLDVSANMDSQEQVPTMQLGQSAF